MKSGIKTRLTWSYVLLIILTVFLFEVIVLAALRFYYVEGVKNTLRDQGAMFTSFMNKMYWKITGTMKLPFYCNSFIF